MLNSFSCSFPVRSYRLFPVAQMLICVENLASPHLFVMLRRCGLIFFKSIEMSEMGDFMKFLMDPMRDKWQFSSFTLSLPFMSVPLYAPSMSMSLYVYLLYSKSEIRPLTLVSVILLLWMRASPCRFALIFPNLLSANSSFRLMRPAEISAASFVALFWIAN